MALNDFIEKGLSEWMQQAGPDSDVVISSRIRLARNIVNIPFSPFMTDKTTEEVMDKVEHIIHEDKFKALGEYELIRMKDISLLERTILVEKHLISPKLEAEYQQSAVILRNDEAANIMINEEDHLRIQCIFPGFQLRAAYDVANTIDDTVEHAAEFAFDEKIGYLTSCVTNVGTGLRASVMVHIPALVMSGQAKRLLGAVQRVGLAVRGYYGEGSEAVGNIFQISNQITLGFSESEIIESLEDVIKQVVEHEREARKQVFEQSKEQLEDKVFRSLGILLHARVISTREAMERISNVRLGIDLGLIDGISSNILKELMVLTGSGFLQKYSGRELTPEERDIKRANVIRERLKSVEIE
ncbi:protein arginine kinase [Desulfuribacillus stibiiarsenatis]|uniref:Protein-arginine kinase n=1 Tax=Desulfuribacillus stibiiarsenatis TaxID=1390249 RepID=A0A1E5L826_9FIRM|nr:protein arginine kinase [Desulfuribacillus stibiiarsenatis]OEH86295.1 protein arginine kinase [Desulfuribacillus stibiiarsenatis]